MPEVFFDRYYRYDDLTAILRGFAEEYPGLVRLESIGKSYEGRDIWMATVTDFSTGPAEDKPAFFCDGNIHATEVSASSAVLYLLNRLCTGHGKDEKVTHVLRTRAFYLVPRLNPDGAEWALADRPKLIRSSVRPWPFDEEDPYGLERMDVDGDGRILNMRVQDPNGPWKVYDKNPRLMVRREPGEVGGTYYRLLPEGLFHNFDGLRIRGRRNKEGLDMNRNYPSGWRVESEQHGAGPFPTSEPEVRAEVEAIVKRPNICGAITFHTFSGVHLRPPSSKPDDELPAEDVWTYKKIGQVGTDLTGYPAIAVYHEFRYHPKEVITGVFDDWMYEHRGVFAWTTEIWSPQRQAGITDYKYIDWFRDHPVEDDEKILQWIEEKLGGKGYVDWYPFDHPQLGPVELGGLDAQYCFRNPPPEFLEAEIAPFSDWVLWQAAASPKLEVRKFVADRLEPDVWRLRLAVQNTGWLPTNVTKLAADKRLVRGVVAEIAKEGCEVGGPGSMEPDWLVAGTLRQDIGQLAGWNHVSAGGFGSQLNSTDDVGVFEWVVRGAGVYRIEVRHERAGRLTYEFRAESQ